MNAGLASNWVMLLADFTAWAKLAIAALTIGCLAVSETACVWFRSADFNACIGFTEPADEPP